MLADGFVEHGFVKHGFVKHLITADIKPGEATYYSGNHADL